MNAYHIERVAAREVFDSRGRPTIEVDLWLRGGGQGRAMVPSGASTGRHEAVELRDGEHRHAGRGVLTAVANVISIIGPAISGQDARDQSGLDMRLIELDGTPDKSRLGANAILGVSLAAARAVAAADRKPLWSSLAATHQLVPSLPLPMVNMISGGMHARRSLDIQDYLIVPVAADSMHAAIEMALDVYRAVAAILAARGLSTLRADEGGFGPLLASNREPLEVLLEACERAGYEPGSQIAFALDVAASHFFNESAGQYELQRDQRKLSASEMIDLLEEWCDCYPICSIEDLLAEDDWEGWQAATARLGSRIQLVGDDLFTTNRTRLARGIGQRAANAVLVKMNQVGTLTETIQVVEEAKQAGFATIVSARSGETEDPSLADLAVATGAGQIKIGSVQSSERMAKYNQLLRIAEQISAAGGEFPRDDARRLSGGGGKQFGKF